jgi:hypothetical protein
MEEDRSHGDGAKECIRECKNRDRYLGSSGSLFTLKERHHDAFRGGNRGMWGGKDGEN